MRKVLTISLCLLSLFATSCKETEEEYICKMTEEFGELYFNQKIQESKNYCTTELKPIMDFRAKNLTEEEKLLFKNQNKLAKVRAIECNTKLNDDVAFVSLEVKDFLRTDFMKDTAFIVKCDTFTITLHREFDTFWKVRDPF